MSVTIEEVGFYLSKAIEEFKIPTNTTYEELAKILITEYKLNIEVDSIKRYYQSSSLDIPSEFESRAIEYQIKTYY